jgi:hypothetical protein
VLLCTSAFELTKSIRKKIQDAMMKVQAIAQAQAQAGREIPRDMPGDDWALGGDPRERFRNFETIAAALSHCN